MKTVLLRFRAVDKKNFDAIRRGAKKIETRAGSPRYRDVGKGDALAIVCGRERILRRVARARRFRSVDALLAAVPYRRIMPWAPTKAAAREVWYGYPGYEERLKEYGVIAWDLALPARGRTGTMKKKGKGRSITKNGKA